MAKSTVKFRDSAAEFERLSREIAARRFAPVYLLMGEESYFIDALCEQLASTARTTSRPSTARIRTPDRSSTSAASCR